MSILVTGGAGYIGSHTTVEPLGNLFSGQAIEAVIYFAGLKAVGMNMEKPLSYYDANVDGTLVLCQARYLYLELGYWERVFCPRDGEGFRDGFWEKGASKY